MLPLRGSGQVYLTGGFSPDGRIFAAGGLGHIVEFWDLADPAALPRQIATDGTAEGGFHPGKVSMFSLGFGLALTIRGGRTAQTK